MVAQITSAGRAMSIVYGGYIIHYQRSTLYLDRRTFCFVRRAFRRPLIRAC